MRFLVTLGPTYESLDEVRRLTNFSTGTLGTELVNSLTEQGHSVTALRGYYAICTTPLRASAVQPLPPPIICSVCFGNALPIRTTEFFTRRLFRISSLGRFSRERPMARSMR